MTFFFFFTTGMAVEDAVSAKLLFEKWQAQASQQ